MSPGQDAESHWCESGAGEPVVLLHGLLGGVEHREASLRTLGRFCRPLAPALPLFEPGLAEPSIPALGEWVRRWVWGGWQEPQPLETLRERGEVDRLILHASVHRYAACRVSIHTSAGLTLPPSCLVSVFSRR